jgi:predicted ABC-type ATPase
VKLYFLWLQSVEAAVARVADRVSRGRHNIPEATIRRRYKAGLRHFFSSYDSVVDEWIIFDSSQPTLKVVARRDEGGVAVTDADVYRRIKEAANGR